MWVLLSPFSSGSLFMYKVLPKSVLFGAFAWLVVGIWLISNEVKALIPFEIKAASIPSLAWLLLNVILWNPIWRWLWRKVPLLNEKVFPDLNGTWDVELQSNWPRQEQMLNAAKTGTPFDISSCNEQELSPLLRLKLRAEISQSWWKIEMKLSNPEQNTPIDRSETISLDPFPSDGQKRCGICYFFKQFNNTDNVADEAEFFGAARLEYNQDADTLEGLVWNARMWRRAMNTAGKVTFRRATSESKIPKKRKTK